MNLLVKFASVVIGMSACLIASAAAAEVSPTCVNISGDYKLAWPDGDNYDLKIKQVDCKYLVVSGTVNSKYDAQPAKNFENLVVYLNGRAPVSFGDSVIDGDPCHLNYGRDLRNFTNFCGLFSANSSYLLKKSTAPSEIADPIHGKCSFLVSQLSRDSEGNLLEIPKHGKCADGFLGDLTPLKYIIQNSSPSDNCSNVPNTVAFEYSSRSEDGSCTYGRPMIWVKDHFVNITEEYSLIRSSSDGFCALLGKKNAGSTFQKYSIATEAVVLNNDGTIFSTSYNKDELVPMAITCQ